MADRVERALAAGVQAARLDLAEHEDRPVESDDVELAPAGPVVTLDDLESAPGQMVGRELFPELPEPMTGVVAHTRHATDRLVARGWRDVTIFSKATPGACGDLARPVTHR